MSYLTLNAGIAPSTPAAGKISAYEDTADPRRVKALDEYGLTHVLSPDGRQNLLLNGDFWLAQRQAPAGATTYSSLGGRVYGADRWWLSNENASVDYRRFDTAAAVEAGLLARWYGRVRKVAALGKFAIGQVVEGADAFRLRGRTVRFQAWMRRDPNAMTVRLGLVTLTSAGTMDTIPGGAGLFITAWGAVGTDPTLGANLAYVVPVVADGGTISGNAMSCVLAATWTRYGATFVVPAGTQNVIPVVWTNAQPAVDDGLLVAQAGLYDGEEVQDWTPRPPTLERAACQRFYQKTFASDTAPAQAVGVDTGEVTFLAGVAGANPEHGAWRFQVPMRATPSVTFYNPAVANVQVRDESAAADCAVTAGAGVTESAMRVACNGAAGTVVGNRLGIHLSLDTEL